MVTMSRCHPRLLPADRNAVQRVVRKDTSPSTSRTLSTTAIATGLEARTPSKPSGHGLDTNTKHGSTEGGPKVFVAGTITTTTTGYSAVVTSTTASPFVSNEASADVRYVAETTSSNGVNAPVRKPLYDDEHGNSFEDALQGGGRDSIMFVSSTPIPFELHHSFDFQNLDTTSGACLDEASLYAEGSAMLSFQLLAITATAFAAQSVASSPSATWRWRTASRSSTSQYDCCPTSYACTKRPNATTPLPPPSTPAAATASTSTSTPTTTSTSTTTTTTEGPVVIPIHAAASPKYHNVEEDDAAVSVYPEHQMNRGVTERHNMPLQGSGREGIETSSRKSLQGNATLRRQGQITR
ncbi:hypothetical protein MRX96_015692 [Rhipicephalus microplus]